MKILPKVFLVAFIPTALAAVILVAFSWHLSRQAVPERLGDESQAHIVGMPSKLAPEHHRVEAMTVVQHVAGVLEQLGFEEADQHPETEVIPLVRSRREEK